MYACMYVCNNISPFYECFIQLVRSSSLKDWMSKLHRMLSEVYQPGEKSYMWLVWYLPKSRVLSVKSWFWISLTKVWPHSWVVLNISFVFCCDFQFTLLTEFCRSTLGKFDGGLNMAFPWQPNLQGTAEWYCNLFFFLSQSPPRTVSSTHSPSHPLHTPQRATFTVSSPQSAFPVSPTSPLIQASPLFPHCHLHHLQNPLQLRSQ